MQIGLPFPPEDTAHGLRTDVIRATLSRDRSRLRGPQNATSRCRNMAWVFVVGVAITLLQPCSALGQSPPTPPTSPASGMDLIREMQARTQAAIQRAESSVVAVARVDTTRDSAGFRIPNLGRLPGAGRLDELLPADADFVPTQYAAGFVVDPRGLVLTTYHGLGANPSADESDFYIWRQHRPLRAKLLAADGWYDLAVLQVVVAGVEGMSWEPLPWGAATTAEKGAFVIALGNPQAVARDGEVCATWSILGGTKRRAPPVSDRPAVATGRETLHHYGTLLQFDAPLHVGYAGGPLINLGGEVIGVTTAYSGQATSARAASFAIPVDESFLSVVNSLKEGKVPSYGFLGVGLQPLDPRARREGRHGAIVESVMQGTPASRADLRIGDRVTHVDGVPLFDDDEVIRAVSRVGAGQTVQVRLVRAGDMGDRILETSIVLTSRGESAVRPNYATAQPRLWRGLAIDDATAAPRDDLLGVELPEHGGGYVVQVIEESPAARAGVRAGQFILTVAGKPFTSQAEFWEIVTEVPGDEVTLDILTPAKAPLQVVVSEK